MDWWITQPLSTIPLKMEEALPESLHLLVTSLEISLVRLGSSSKICLNNRSFNWRSVADFVVLSQGLKGRYKRPLASRDFIGL